MRGNERAKGPLLPFQRREGALRNSSFIPRFGILLILRIGIIAMLRLPALLLLALAACAPREDAAAPETAAAPQPAAAAPDDATPGPVVPVETPSPAGTYRLDKSHASLVFKVDHIGFSNYTGQFRAFDATLTFDPANGALATGSPTSRTISASMRNRGPRDSSRFCGSFSSFS